MCAWPSFLKQSSSSALGRRLEEREQVLIVRPSACLQLRRPSSVTYDEQQEEEAKEWEVNNACAAPLHKPTTQAALHLPRHMLLGT